MGWGREEKYVYGAGGEICVWAGGPRGEMCMGAERGNMCMGGERRNVY